MAERQGIKRPRAGTSKFSWNNWRNPVRLCSKEGLLVGISAGASALAAVRVAERLGPQKQVLTILCDTGERYLSTGIFSMAEDEENAVCIG